MLEYVYNSIDRHIFAHSVPVTTYILEPGSHFAILKVCFSSAE